MKGKKRIFLCFLILGICLAAFPAAASVNPSADAAAIKASGISAGMVRVEASVPSPVNSLDSFYYLFEVNANTNKLVKKLREVEKPAHDYAGLTFDLDSGQDPAFALMKYALAVKTGSGSSIKKYTRISPAVFAANPEKAARYRTAYRYPKTKKGLQTTSLEELSDTNSKNCFINIEISQILQGQDTAFTYNGENYFFNSLYGYRDFVSRCNEKGILVTAQLMLDQRAPSSLMAFSGGGAAYYAFRVNNRTARQWMDAIFAYMAEAFGTDSCYISNWILGNEINSSLPYYYMGNVTEKQLAANYSASFRSLYNAVRSVRASSRVFICLEHCWTIRNSTAVSFPGKTLLKRIHKNLNRLQPGIAWNLAFHAYPFNLLDPAVWNDPVTDSENAEIISPKNLKALTTYIKKTYGKKRRIIISEIGFNSRAGEDAQAAGLALSYGIAACNPMIDAFLVRSYRDDPNDAAYGVTFGIKGRKAFQVFCHMDTTSYLKYTKNILKKTVGNSWKKYIPGYQARKMYRHYHS